MSVLKERVDGQSLPTALIEEVNKLEVGCVHVDLAIRSSFNYRMLSVLI